MRIRNLLMVATACFASVATFAQVRLVQHHQPVSRIVLTTADQTDSVAAVLLQDFVHRSTQTLLPIVRDGECRKLRKGDVLIGNGRSNAPYVTP